MKHSLRILTLARYGTLGASSRLRFYQYIPYLKEHGIEVTVTYLLDDDYLRNLYLGRRRSFFALAGAYFRRLRELMRSQRFDLIWLQNELFPWLPAWPERLLAHRGMNYVVDYDDAVFHRYDEHRQRLVRVLLGRKIDVVMRHAALVIVGNDYLLDRARQAGARSVSVLPTVVDLERYPARPSGQLPGGQGFRIGWIGLPFGLQYLEHIQPALRRVCSDGQAELVIVGARTEVFPGLPAEVREWREETEVEDIQTFDVGIMPLVDNAWERGKCGYKLIQYMACSKPVVASPVGVNRQIVEDGVNGFLASSEEEWVRALNTLRADIELRQRMGQAGRAKVEQLYCTRVAAPQLLSLLRQVSRPRDNPAVTAETHVRH